MFHDGATRLEDIRHLQEDMAYQEILQLDHLPTSDALGDWLRRQGENHGEQKTQRINGEFLKRVIEQEDVTLDIDATIVESNKGDAQKSYKGIVGYQPLLGIIAENGIIAGSEFRQGNISPQSGLWQFVEQCELNYGKTIKPSGVIRQDTVKK